MHDDRQQRIRERAYAIWEAEGHPEGQAEQNWTAAEEALRAEEGLEETPAPLSLGEKEAAGDRDLITMGIVLP